MANNYLKIFLNENIANLTNYTTFDIAKFCEGNSIIYIGFGEYANLGALMLKMIYKFSNLYLEENKKQYLDCGLLFIVDEFANIPKMDFIPRIFSLDAGKNIFANLVFQSKGQILDIYNENIFNILIDCTSTIIITRLYDINLEKDLSVKSGKRLVKTVDNTTGKDSSSQTKREVLVPNVNPDFFINKKDEEFIFVTNKTIPFKYNV
jgi:type IV secretory pathway TraG/TraD family ATPase VirD4